MLRLALRSILAKKRRLVGTALSVMLGVAFLSGTLVFTDTIGRTFDDLFADIYANTDSYVRSQASVDTGTGSSQRARIPEKMVAEVARVPGVADARGTISGFAQIVGSDGRAIGNPGQGSPTFATNYSSRALTPWDLTSGSQPPGPGELVIDKGSADKGHLHIGDTVTVITQTGPHKFPLVGIARFGSVDSPGGASVSVLDLATAQQILVGGKHEIDAVMVEADPGVDEKVVTARIQAILPKGLEALTGSAITKENQDLLRQGLSFFNTFLLVFAAIGLVVACFTIYNTFQIIVSQRAREMALLRSIGATRRQVLLAQLLEAVIIGVVASVIGLFAGVVVAGGLKGMLEAVGIDIPAGGTVFAARTVFAALTVGIVVTSASAVIPSWRASRVPPLAAIRNVDSTSSSTDSGTGRRLLLGGTPLVIGIGAFAAGLAGAGLLWVGIGALLTFIATFTLGPLIARPIARLLGAPVARIVGITGLLARENAVRNPGRTARTGGALMVGIALVAAITIIAATAKDWTHDTFDRQFTGDYVVSTKSVGYGGLSPEVAARLNKLPEVGVATGVRIGSARVQGAGNTGYVAVDPRTASKLFDLGMVKGSVADLDTEGLLVDDDVASAHHLVLGDKVTFGFLDGSRHRLTVEGIYHEDALAGPYVISHALHEETGADQFDFSVYVSRAPGVDEAAAAAAIERVIHGYANAQMQSRSDYIADQAGQVDQIVNLMYGLLALAILIALISIANSISLSINERTRELGLLRAVGMTRHQVGSTIRWEAAIVATLGAGLGIGLGVFFGWAISVTMRDEGLFAVTLPIPALAGIAGIGVVGGVLASLRPAWRGSHLDILQAVGSE